MPGIDRTTIITGPCIVQFAGQSFWSKGDVTVAPKNKRFPVETSRFGKVDERFSSRMIEVTFEPEGRFTAGLAAVLWPYAGTNIGTSIYGAADRALVVWGVDGVKLTIHNASLTQMPNLRLGVSKTISGNVKFTGLLAKSTDPANAAAYYTIAAAAYPGDAGFAVSDIPTSAFTTVWGGSAPWSSFQTEAGWEIAFSLKLKEQEVDGLGTVDMSLQGLDVSAKAIPVGPTMAQAMAKLMPAVALGSSLAAGGADLVIASAAVTATVKNASLADAQFAYSSDKKRLGSCEWIATRTVTAGALDPLFSIAVTA